MKAYSAVIVTRDEEPNDGSTLIEFDKWEEYKDRRRGREGALLNPPWEEDSDVVGIFDDTAQVGGSGNFQSKPAHIVHIREVKVEDSQRGWGRREIDDWEINSTAWHDALYIEWRTPEARSEVEEIGFLVIGE